VWSVRTPTLRRQWQWLTDDIDYHFDAVCQLLSLIGCQVLGWFGSIIRRKQVRADWKICEERVRRFLQSYLAADAARKHVFYELVAGAAAACEPSITDPNVDNFQMAQKTSDVAFNVVRHRLKGGTDYDCIQSMITDAYATVATAHRRAAAVYTTDPELQRLGTAAVHLVTMARSYMALMRPEV
jgi:hypothetical protein